MPKMNNQIYPKQSKGYSYVKAANTENVTITLNLDSSFIKHAFPVPGVLYDVSLTRFGERIGQLTLSRNSVEVETLEDYIKLKRLRNAPECISISIKLDSLSVLDSRVSIALNVCGIKLGNLIIVQPARKIIRKIIRDNRLRDRSVICELCGTGTRQFRSTEHLKLHLQNVHSLSDDISF